LPSFISGTGMAYARIVVEMELHCIAPDVFDGQDISDLVAGENMALLEHEMSVRGIEDVMEGYPHCHFKILEVKELDLTSD
jgi:hypothetical protein